MSFGQVLWLPTSWWVVQYYHRCQGKLILWRSIRSFKVPVPHVGCAIAREHCYAANDTKSVRRRGHDEAYSSSKFCNRFDMWHKLIMCTTATLPCVRLVVQEGMTDGANEVRRHSSRTFVSISRILHARLSLLIALTLALSTSNDISHVQPLYVPLESLEKVGRKAASDYRYILCSLRNVLVWLWPTPTCGGSLTCP